MIDKYLDSNGRLGCLDAFKAARKLGVKPIEMADICEELGIKITNCELGVFGKLQFQDAEIDIYKTIEKNFTKETDISCKRLWEIAQKSSLRRVGSAVKNSNAEVVYCQLGCFNERKNHREIKS